MRPHWPPVLMYHAVTRVADDPNQICVSPERFEAQMRFLKRCNLRGVAMRKLCGAMKSGHAGGLIGLTFDDGYEDFLQNALPVLERFGFTATVFVPVGLIGKENIWDEKPRMRLLGTRELQEVWERGMEVGSHSMNHARLSGLKPERLEEEVSDSRKALEGIFGEEVKGFCYPYGELDGVAIQAVRRAGYSYACAYKSRVEQSIYDIPRIYAGERDGTWRLQAKLRLYPYYLRAARRFR